MSHDLSNLLASWPYESGQINVRLIQGDDGEPKVQMRLDLGVLQMEAFGPPDGVRPHGYDSLLESFETMLDEAYDDTDPDADEPDEDPDFSIGPEDCRKLREEAVQYYHRYISLLILGEFMGVLRDTTRNLRLVDFMSRYAENEDDRQMLEQFRPYITMMRARAIASQMIADDEPKAAIFFIDKGLEDLRALCHESGHPDQFESSHEAQILGAMRSELSKKLPSSQSTELRQRLDEAIRNENYELAAILRDELRMLGPDTHA